MSELQRLLKVLLKFVLPTQQNTASGVVQAGKVDGNITVINHHHHAPPSVPPSPPQRKTVRANAEQKAILRLMDEVPDRIAVLDFMEREFDTRMVIELGQPQLYRLRRYIEVVIESSKGTRQ